MAAVRVFVFADRCGSLYRAGRTLRALQDCGLAAEDATCLADRPLAERLTAEQEPAWLVRAGAWPAGRGAITPPLPSSTGLPLCGLGAVVAEPDEWAAGGNEAAAWSQRLAETGGDFRKSAGCADGLPPLASVYLEWPVVRAVAEWLAAGASLPEALTRELGREGRRVVRIPAFDVHFTAGLRVAHVVTSVQRGGAERMVLDLHHRLPQHGFRSLLVTLGRPTRSPFPVPPGTVDLSRAGPSGELRAAAAAEAVRRFAADVVHGNLLCGGEAAALAASGVPLLMTVHNARPGWPDGLAELRPGVAALLVACSQAAEADLRTAPVPAPFRTVWNGIDFRPFERTPEVAAAAAERRRQLGLSPDDFVLLTVANPRPQKRLEWLPGILAATQAELARRGCGRRVHWALAGEASRISAPAKRAVAALQEAIGRSGLAGQIHWIGAAEDLPPLLAAADVLVSTSAYEGLSLAHVEALAAGIPLVTTAAGGTPELAVGNPAVRLLPLDATPDQFAQPLAELVRSPPPSGRDAAAVHFSLNRMAEGYRRLYPRAIVASSVTPRPARDGLWLVTNNFSTGGAQSSARRLLVGLAEQGVRVRAAVLEEPAEFPTPGRRALTAAGISVRALPPVGTIDTAEAVALLLEQLDAAPPQAVLLWNVIPEYKLLLADSLLDVPLFDVSPGEMYFASLDRYFRQPRPGLPYRSPRDYGRRLAGVIVKYHAEASRAAEVLDAPVHVIANGVPLDELPLRTADSFNRDPPGSASGGMGSPTPLPAFAGGARLNEPMPTVFVLGTAARISPQKKLEELLHAVRVAADRLPPFVLRIAGGVERGCAEYADELRRLAAGLPVEWLGELEDPREFYRGLALFAMISEPAGCPNASLEAMAAGLPVVATDVGGAREQVLDGVAGRIVPRGDTRAFADALVQLATDGDQRQRFGAAARERMATHFNVRRMVADYRRVVLETGQGRGTRE